MDREEITRLAAQLRLFGIGYVHVQGGEPSLRKDLTEIVDIFLRHAIKPTVISNGISFFPELSDDLARRNCNVSFSLDTLGREEYAQLRGVDELDTVMRHITYASRIRKRRGNWSIVSTLTRRSTLECVKRLESFAGGNGFMYAVRPYVFVRGVAGKQCVELECDPCVVIPIFEYMAEQARRNNYLAWLVYREQIRYLRKDAMPACDALRRSIFVDETGMFCPCIEFPDLRFSLGDFSKARRDYAREIAGCNVRTPCFYNCGRVAGIVWRNKIKIAVNIPRIFAQMARYGNFF
jgi:MoaA/NifB/PqqE/SkfB family radical SAM enzyme